MDENEKIESETIETTEESLPDIVADIRAEYEKKISDMITEHQKAIVERDTIIKQLISGGAPGQQRETFVERLNNKRNFKKW